jgi:hypothetical protein
VPPEQGRKQIVIVPITIVDREIHNRHETVEGLAPTSLENRMAGQTLACRKASASGEMRI